MTTFQSPKDTYTVIREYAHGGMGVTYLVTGAKTGQQLILKQMHLSRVSDWKMVELFEREAEVLRKLNHQQIPKYIDYFAEPDNKQFCLVQSFIEGVTMQSVIEKQTPVDEKEFRQYLRQSLQILKYLHRLVPPVIHRDITPKNIILNDGKAFLVDFGSVKNMINPLSSGMSTSVGTFGYMPPEQIMGQSVPASDMYSLGVSFMALATHSDPMRFPLNPKTGQIDANKLLGHLPDNIRTTLEHMTLPGLENRLSDPDRALEMLDNKIRAQVPEEETAREQAPERKETFPGKFILKKPMALFLGIFLIFIIVLTVVLTVNTAPENIRQDPDDQRTSRSVSVPEKKDNPSGKKTEKQLRPAVNLSRSVIDSVLISNPWIGHSGENQVKLSVIRKSGTLSGTFIEYHKRRKDFSGPSSRAEIEVSSLGIITISSRRVSDGVNITESYYGNITDDLTGLFGNCERHYQQSGSGYTTTNAFYFRNTVQ